MPTATDVLALTIGGALGVNARYWLGLAVGHWCRTRFPWATLLINVSGSFLIGLLAVAVVERWPSPAVRLGAVTGFLGGYTTFSSFMLESWTLWERGERTLAVANTLGSVALGLGAVILGVALGRAWFEPSSGSSMSRRRIDQRIVAVAEADAGIEPSPAPDS